MQKQYMFRLGIVFVLILGASWSVQAQVKIGNNPTNINNSALLHLENRVGQSRGMIFPYVNLPRTDEPIMGTGGQTAVRGMVVYNTNTSIIGTATYPASGVGIYSFDGTGWVYGGIPSGGSTGQVLSKTATGLAWGTPASGLVRYTIGSTSGAGAIVKATGTGVTMSVDISTQTATFTIPAGVELLSVRMWEMNTSSSGSYGMSASVSVLNIKYVFLDTNISNGFTSTVLPQMNTVLHATAINPYYMDARGTTTQARKYEVIGQPAGNQFTIRVPQMDPSTLGQVGWSILFNF